MNENMSRPVTRGELDEILAIWSGALRAEMATRAQLEALRGEMKQMGKDLLAEMRILINGAFEMIRSDIRVLDDKVNGVDTKVSVLDTKVSVLDDKVNGLDTRVTVLDDKLTRVDANVTVVDDKVTRVEGKVTAIDDRCADLPPRVDALERKAAGRSKRR